MGELDAETQAAISACVRSIEELEVLLFLARHAERYCSAGMVSAETGFPEHLAARALEALASRNLLDVRISAAVLYRLDPAGPGPRAAVERSVDAAWRDRTGVLKAILGASSAARDFADAFRVTRKRRSDG